MSLTSSFASIARDDVDLSVNMLRQIWVIVGCRGRDALSDQVEDLGSRLSTTMEAEDWAECREVIQEAHHWVMTMGGGDVEDDYFWGEALMIARLGTVKEAIDKGPRIVSLDELGMLFSEASKDRLQSLADELVLRGQVSRWRNNLDEIGYAGVFSTCGPKSGWELDRETMTAVELENLRRESTLVFQSSSAWRGPGPLASGWRDRFVSQSEMEPRDRPIVWRAR